MQPREKQRENDSRHRSPFPSSSPSRPHLSAGGGGIFPTGCFQLVPRLFRPFSSLCPPPIRAMPRNAFYSLRGSARVSRRRLHGCIYITCSSVDISLFFSCFVFFLEWFPLVFGRVDSIGMHDVWSSYSLCRAPFPWMSLGVCADPRLDLAIWFKIFLSLFSSSFCNENSFEVSIWWRQVELIFREGARRRPTFRINGEEI